ncbi:hypothetical protein ACFX2I_026323 [Malus domestica]
MEIEKDFPSSDFFFTKYSYLNKEDLLDAQPVLKHALQFYGISCTLDMDEGFMTLSALRRHVHEDIFIKANVVINLFFEDNISKVAKFQSADPLLFALEFLYNPQYDIIKIGYQVGGLCTKYAIPEGHYWGLRSIFQGPGGCFLKDLQELTGCSIVVCGHDVLATGSFNGLRIVRMIVEDCFVYRVAAEYLINRVKEAGVHCARVMNVWFQNKQHGPLEVDENGIPQKRDNSKPIEEESNSCGDNIYYRTNFPKDKEKYVLEAWPKVKSFLEEHGISCELHLVESFMIISRAKRDVDQDIFDKARAVLDLLPSDRTPQAIELLNARQYEIIKFGNQDYGLISKFGIKKVEPGEWKELLIGPDDIYIKALRELTDCFIVVNWKTETVVATGSFEGLRLVRIVVEDCIYYKVHAGHLIDKIRTRGARAYYGTLRFVKVAESFGF